VKERLILDAGPLVAFLDRREARHGWATRRFSDVSLPFLVCEPVLTEACFLLRRMPRAVDQIGAWMEAGYLNVAFELGSHGSRVFALMEKYRDLPMSLADACLVRMVEAGLGDRVLTLDRHFRTYRHSGRRVVPVSMPEAGEIE